MRSLFRRKPRSPAAATPAPLSLSPSPSPAAATPVLTASRPESPVEVRSSDSSREETGRPSSLPPTCSVLGVLDQPGQFWLRVEGGANSYFFEAVSGATAWELPIGAARAWRRRILEAEALDTSAIDDRPSDSVPGPRSPLSSPGGHGSTPDVRKTWKRQEKTASSELTRGDEPGSPTTVANGASWVVKVHPDCGLPFYERTSLDTTSSDAATRTWWNPATPSVAELLTAQDDREAAAVEEQNRRLLAGFDASPSVDFEADKEYRVALDRLEAWAVRSGVEQVEAEAVRFRYPSYYDASRDLSILPTNAGFDVRILFSVDPTSLRMNSSKANRKILAKMGAPETGSFTTLHVTLRTTVSEIIDTAFREFERAAGQSLAEDAHAHVLKVVGYADYFVHKAFMLGVYDHIVNCVRRGIPVVVKLVELTESDLMDVGHVMAETTADVLLRERAGRAPEGDHLVQDERARMRALVSGLKPIVRMSPVETLYPPVGRYLDDLDSSSRNSVSSVSTGSVGERRSSAAGVGDRGGAYVDQSAVDWPLRVRIAGISECPQDTGCIGVYVQACLYFNGGLVPPAERQNVPYMHIIDAMPQSDVDGSCTEMAPVSRSPRFAGVQMNVSEHVLADVHPQARVGFMVFGLREDGRRMPLAGVVVPLADSDGRILSGSRVLRLWPHQELQLLRDQTLGKGENPNPRNLNLASGYVGENTTGWGAAGVLHVQFDDFNFAIYSTARPSYILDYLPVKVQEDEGLLSSQKEKQGRPPWLPMYDKDTVSQNPNLREVMAAAEALDPLDALSVEQCTVLWDCRARAALNYKLLPKFLQSVNWCYPTAVHEARRMLTHWAPCPAGQEVSALELLDIRYSDPVVREYAVLQLDRLPDSELEEYLLQLVQALKYEPHIDSALARFVLRRALRAPLRIGHPFFWHLRSEMHQPDCALKFGCLLLVYLRHAGRHAEYLRRQHTVNHLIKEIAEAVKTRPKAEMLLYARLELAKLNAKFPARFQTCLTPRIECSGLVVNKCKVMHSKKLPLWLHFKNADPDGSAYLAIYKCGDDLRQDLMTLQMLRIMDKMWMRRGIDLRLRPYACCATGHELGWIEVVQQSSTTSMIQREHGGTIGGAFDDKVISRFLKTHNASPDEQRLAVENFVYSCAGYCVATYVLGIGDRHADNIMITNDGHLFHIDFGHFLGNFKSKMGIKRERAPFVFTPEMAFVMHQQRDQSFSTFQNKCCAAFNVLRADGNHFINLFVLMTPAAMPELLEKDDITYLRDMLDLRLHEEQAAKKFRQEIRNSLRTVSRRLDNMFHNVKHG